MYRNHRIDRRRIVFFVLTLTHIISHQISLIECLTIGGDYENGKLSHKYFLLFLHETNNHYIITYITWVEQTRGLIKHNVT